MQDRGRSRSPLSGPASNHGRGLSRSTSPNGTPKRVRKGRGFTDRYSYARRYRTPSPEHSPHSSYHYGGGNVYRRNNDRYFHVTELARVAKFWYLHVFSVLVKVFRQ